jgi:hypothetical protein
MSHVCAGETPSDLVLRFPACNAETKARGAYNPTRVNTDPPQAGSPTRYGPFTRNVLTTAYSLLCVANSC